MNGSRGNGSGNSGLLLGLFVCVGLAALGYQLATAAIQYKAFERTVTVKGLSEREYQADTVIWPIQFTLAGNELESLYNSIEGSSAQIHQFLQGNGIQGAEISNAIPAITDKSAQQWDDRPVAFRYSAVQTVTVHSSDVEAVREVMGKLSELGKTGIVFSGDNYQAQPQYTFTRLNEVKPEMVEEATRNAREVAQKFAADSDSTLGKIKRASQGQFSINPRDASNPHIKNVRVVSTIEYYLAD